MWVRRQQAWRAATGAVLVAVVGAGAAPATARPVDAEVTSGSQVAAKKMVNVVGLPVKAPIPAGWAVTSPKELAESGSRRYPLMVRTQARAERKTPARWVSDNRGLNALALAHPGYSFSQGIAFSDLGLDALSTDMLGRATSEFPGMTGTSTVQTRFGTAYRIHFTDVDSHSRIRFHGVAAFFQVNDHILSVTSVGKTAASAKYPNDLALKGATRR